MGTGSAVRRETNADSSPTENHEGLSRAGSRLESGGSEGDGRSRRSGTEASGTNSRRSGHMASHSIASSRTRSGDGMSPNIKAVSGDVTSGARSRGRKSHSELDVSGNVLRPGTDGSGSMESASTLSSVNSAPPSAVDIMDFHINLPFSGRQNQHMPTQQSTRQAQQSGHKQHPSHHIRQSRRSPSWHHVELSSEQQKKVTECFWLIEPVLDIRFDIDAIIENVVLVEGNGGVVELCENSQAKGICVVDEGELELMVNDEVIDMLIPGDFCGELAALFRVSQNIKTKFNNRVSLLLIPTPVVQRNFSGAYLGREAMMQWCIKRSYIEASKFFGKINLSHEIIVNCLRSSIFRPIVDEALYFIASLVKPMLFNKDDILYSIGDQSTYVYFILRGRLQCTENNMAAESRNVRFSDEGHCIGNGDLFNGKAMRQGATAMGPLLVVPIGAEIILEMANQFPAELPKLKQFLGDGQ